MNVKKGLSYLLIIAGICILLYPMASEWYDNRQQEKLMQEWETVLAEEAAVEAAAQEEYNRLTSLFDEAELEEEALAVIDPTGTPSVDASAEPAEPEPTVEPTEPPPAPIATIKIPSIDLKLPVLEGATQKNMKSAAAHLNETAAVGDLGNAAIAAHRMKKKGRLFNRLDEVAVGDKVVVETKEETFTYSVYKVSVVEPTDVSVLNYNKKDKLLTLITCDPIVNPTHRLIVHAKLEG